MADNNNNNKAINRRDFIKYLGGGAAAVAAVSIPGCGSQENSKSRGGTSITEVPTDKMTYRLNPRTNEKVSILGYGCMRWPLLQNPAPGTNVIDQDAVNELVDYALAHGVNYFDTSPVYIQGWSERSTGVALSRHPRESYYIATKLSNFDPLTHSREASMKMYHNSLEYLKTDYIDYMLLHSIGRSIADFETRYIKNGMLDFLVAEREAGRIRNLGWSFHGTKEVYDYVLSLHDKYHWDFVQIQLNYPDWKYQNPNAEYLLTELEKRNIPVVVMEPLLGGRLARVPEYLAQRLKSERPERSIASWAFRYAGTPQSILTVLSGMTYMEHLQDNIISYAPLDPISENENELLMDVATMMTEYPLVPCTSCQYCMPCPYGIDIPSTFVHYNKCITEGNFPQNTQDENYAKTRKAFLVGYDRSVPKLRQASHCIGCDQCSHHCPQKIKIPQQLMKIDEYVEKLKQEKF